MYIKIQPRVINLVILDLFGDHGKGRSGFRHGMSHVDSYLTISHCYATRSNNSIEAILVN